jgi:glycosyltransferase involved in cell wall biosynthesis
MNRNSHAQKERDHWILMVGMVNSPHFQKWISGMKQSGEIKKVLVFPTDRYSGIPEFYKQFDSSFELKVLASHTPHKIFYYVSFALDYFMGNSWRSFQLSRAIRRYSPRIIHFHEMQHGAYLFNKIESKFRIEQITKIVSTWGSDLTIFSKIGKNLSSDGLRNPGHSDEIARVLSWTDILTAERYSEIEDAARMGYGKEFIAPVYITVGLEEREVSSVKTPPSRRSQVIIKGYQHDAGRALNALEAIRRIQGKIQDFEIVIYSASESVRIQAELISFETGIKIRIMPRIAHNEVLKEFEKSRVYVGLSISDGLSTSMVEAMSTGCFPIQSQNSAAGMFLKPGVSGFIVDPWEIDDIARKILIALEDDEMVDKAAVINMETLHQKYNFTEGIKIISSLYSC